MGSFASSYDILGVQWSHWAKCLVNFKVIPDNDQHMLCMHRNTHNDRSALNTFTVCTLN